MKSILIILLLLTAVPCFAQHNKNCRDVVYLQDGSVFRGKITEYQVGGELIMTSWSGAQIRLSASNVQKIEQQCPHEKRVRTPLSQRPYSFRESGWYHASRAAIMGSQSGAGWGLQHSSGVHISRLLGIGLGVGIENFTPGNGDVTTCPLFGELRGYVLPGNISPFYTLAAGWGWADKKTGQSAFDGSNETWRGGWMAQAQIGQRIGNHFTIHVGLRFQRKTRSWQSPWWNITGVDRILQKRFELGVGILL